MLSPAILSSLSLCFVCLSVGAFSGRDGAIPGLGSQLPQGVARHSDQLRRLRESQNQTVFFRAQTGEQRSENTCRGRVKLTEAFLVR